MARGWPWPKLMRHRRHAKAGAYVALASPVSGGLTRWQAAAWPGPAASSCGSIRRQTSMRAGSACGSGSRAAERSGSARRRGPPRAAPEAGPRHRDRGHQALGVGVPGAGVEALLVGDLDDLAEVHHRDPVGDVLHDAEVVRDEQVGQAELGLQVLQQVDDLRLDRDVERADRLVADDELGVRARARGRCRCAGAGRPRTRAGSARRGAASPTTSSSSRTRRLCSARVPERCTTIGSAMMSPTVIRGLSEPYGSWKMICISRRSARSRSGPARQALAVEADACRRSARSGDSMRPVVDLPQPDSPTSPSVSPRRDREVDAVDRAHRARPRARTGCRW